jgi:hypothetical protein
MVGSTDQIQEQIQTISEGTWLPETVVLHDQLPRHGDHIYVPDDPKVKQHILQLYHNSPLASHLSQQGTHKLVK